MFPLIGTEFIPLQPKKLHYVCISFLSEHFTARQRGRITLLSCFFPFSPAAEEHVLNIHLKKKKKKLFGRRTHEVSFSC